MTLEDIDDNCFCVHPSDYYSELRVKPAEMGVLKQKYGMMWDGTKESAKAFEGKIIEYPVIPIIKYPMI